MLTVFRNFLKVVVERGKFLKLLLEVTLHLACDLVGTLGNDAYGLVDVAGVGRQLDHVASERLEGGVDFLVVDIVRLMFLGISL